MLLSLVLMKRRKSDSAHELVTLLRNGILAKELKVTRSGTDEYDIYSRVTQWGYEHKTVNHGHKEYARDDDGDGFCEVHVNTMEGIWSLLRSWIRPYRGISQEKLPLYLAYF